MISVVESLRRITARLQAAGVEDPVREARLVLAHALDTDLAGLLGRGNVPEDAGSDLAERRARREPLAYIIGRREFWSLPFKVSPASLIPRPESETLIEAALEAKPDRASVRRILDLGTGTGCLLLAAMSEYPAAFGIGIDLTPEATLLARENARALQMQDRAGFLAGDWAAAVEGHFDLVFSNPPYVCQQDIASLMPEVAHHEPRLALNGGTDGLSAYRSLIGYLPKLLAADGLAVVELGQGQAERVVTFVREAGLFATSRADIAGVQRALIVRTTTPAKFAVF